MDAETSLRADDPNEAPEHSGPRSTLSTDNDHARSADTHRGQRSIGSDEPPLGGPQIEVDLPPSADGASFEAWRGYQSWAGSVDLADPRDLPAFSAAARLYPLEPFLFHDVSTSHAVRFVRKAEDIERTGVDHVTVALHLSGTYVGVSAGTAFVAQPGDVSFLDFGQPFALDVSAYRALGLTVPRTAMSEAMRGRSLGGLVLSAGAATELLVQMMRSFGTALPRMTRVEATAAALALTTLADGASCHVPQREPMTTSPPRLRLYDRARAEIVRNLGSNPLTPGTIANALGVSRTTLYNLFQTQGGIQAYIRECRLHACYESLISDLRPNDSIAAIAASYGFPRESHFSRLFKQRYGVTPRQTRATGRNRRVAIEPARQDALASVLIASLGR